METHIAQVKQLILGLSSAMPLEPHAVPQLVLYICMFSYHLPCCVDSFVTFCSIPYLLWNLSSASSLCLSKFSSFVGGRCLSPDTWLE